VLGPGGTQVIGSGDAVAGSRGTRAGRTQPARSRGATGKLERHGTRSVRSGEIARSGTDGAGRPERIKR
jgi:hypothetical protein